MNTRLIDKKFTDLMDELSVLDKNLWPLNIPNGFGISKVRNLCKKFGLPERKIIIPFGNHLDNIGRQIPTELKPRLNCIEVIPCNTAECERGFSHMNNIIDGKRTRLLITHTSSHLFININGPPLSEWKPINYAK